MKEPYPYWLGNRPVSSGGRLPVTNKLTGQVAACVVGADDAALHQAADAAVQAAEACRRMPSYRRAAVLHHVVQRIEQRREAFAHLLAVEVGKPIKDARGEVTRAVDTFRLAAEEATRIGGEYMPLDISPRAEGYEGFWKRVPVGPCVLITPFNFPINLAAHKVAPAIAAGCSWVLKPATATPISSLVLGEILAETDLPAGAFSILPCPGALAQRLVTDDRFKLVSFTGSQDVGWSLKALAGKKRVALELGGNAACVVDEGVDLDYAASRIIMGAFYQSGQSCVSVQRIIAHRSIYEDLKSRLVAAASSLKMGDPLDEQTFLGPMISEAEARRVEAWVADAVARGAKIACGGRREGVFYEATLVENVPADAALSCREVFGPVATLQPFETFEQACRSVNASRYGLQAGVFTKDLDRAFYALNELEVGGVVINDVPSFRVDNMPYGGVKDSGLGREGVRFAIEEMTELRLMLLNGVGRRV